ncbi:gfo/Idh/MocA family oxidoreductase [Alphaproteobacteria bacterium HT1-32]|nr:gfo/Idh/MocA family oxidoreductase [Alphaproteobacteria bacterium HT1-32]
MRVGIAGFGVVGQRRREHIDAHPDMQTVAVADRSFETDGTFEDGVRYYRSYRDLLGENLDALFVCLTNDVAAEVTRAGLERGFHLFCEKPPGRNVEDIESVREVEQQRPDLVLKYGFNHRYHDSVQDALTLVRSGELGRVLNMKGAYGKSAIINFQSDWRTKREIAGGGILLDQGIHMVDLMRLFAGEFDDVHSFVSNDYWKHDVEDNAFALMRSRSGVVAMLHSTATQWRHRFNLEMALEEGTIVLAGLLTGSKSYGAETLTVAWRSHNGEGDPKEQVTRYNTDPSWRREIDEFADAVMGRAEVQNGSSADALATMELVYRIYRADPEWRERWDL